MANGLWNYPSGGRLIPPDLFSMIFAAPWLGLGLGRGLPTICQSLPRLCAMLLLVGIWVK